MKKGIITILISIIVVSLSQCKLSPPVEGVDNYKIKLKWFQAYPTENKNHVEVGLKWIMHYLGANQLADNYNNAIEWEKNNILTLNIEPLGFSVPALKVWKQIIASLKQSNNYIENDWIDIGRFIALTFNNTHSYYAITGVPETFDVFKAKYEFDEKYDYLIRQSESCVAKGFRFINVASADTISKIAYISKEGIGASIETFKEKEFEVIDIMENGQPRFAIYNLDGSLLLGGKPSVTTAGKPAKCMWCHTSKIQPLIFAQTDTPGFGKLKNFKKIIKNQNKKLKSFCRSSNQSFAADSIKQHSYAELLYVTYEEPTYYRLRNEGISEEILDKYKSKTHVNEEYTFFNNLSLDSVISRKVMYPDFNITTRETNEDEVNLLQ